MAEFNLIIVAALSGVIPEHIGIAIEPIATMADPGDDVEGDYEIRICFDIDSIDDGKRYVSVFNCSIAINTFLKMSDKRLSRNIQHIISQAIKYKKGLDAAEDGQVLTDSEVVSLASIRNTAMRKKN
ncbi:MAG: hypothetical protein KAG66_21570 [Methylococcales bacterium]|nr:hypothetical protein [Methylococcales bacterium]